MYFPFDLVLFAFDCHLFHASCHILIMAVGHEILLISPLQVTVDQALQRLDGIVEAGKVIEKKSGVTAL